MKKLFLALLMIGVLAMTGLLFYGASIESIESGNESPPNTQASADQSPDCANIPNLDLAGQRSLGLIISNRQLLSIKLAQEKNFSPPGGHLERNETPTTALRRELLEEINLKIPEDKLASYKVTCSLNNGVNVRTYYYLVDAPEHTINTVSTGDSLKWVDYSFAKDKKSDQELSQALFYLKQDNLID